jgi:methionine-rich copper-binding protein CopC
VIDRHQSALVGWRRRLLAVLASAVLAAGASAGPAAAHNVLISSSPADGASVPHTPAAVVLTFDEPAITMGTQVLVSGPTGEVQQGSPRLVNNTVTQDLASGAAAGAYTVTWRVTSLDGHPVSGTLTFTAVGAGADRPATAPAPTPDTADPSSGSMPWWLWAVIVLVVATTAGAGARAISRARSRGA